VPAERVVLGWNEDGVAMRFALSLVFALILLGSAMAQAPKTIYIDASPDTQPIKEQVIDKLHTWGEIEVVNLPEQADLILQLVQSEKLLVTTGSGNRGSVVLKSRRTGDDLWGQSRGGAWSMRGWSNAWVGKKLGSDLVSFLSKEGHGKN